MEKVAILIVTNDAYLAAFGNIWWKCFKHYWSDCHWPVLFVTPTADLPGLPVLTLSKDEGWNRRALAGLQELNSRHKPDTTLILHEDYLIGPQRNPGAYNSDILKCVNIMAVDPRVRSIGLVRKDPETKPYEGWPEMLGYHALGGGILPVDVGGINLWKTTELERHLKEVIKEIPVIRDQGRNGAAEFSLLGSIWAKQREETHLRVRRHILYPQGILHILFGVTLTLGQLVMNGSDIGIVEQALCCKLLEIKELQPYINGSTLKL